MTKRDDDQAFDAQIVAVGKMISQARRTHGLTQEQLAERLGIAPRALQKIEAGENVTVRTLARIAHVFGTEVKISFMEQG